MQERHRDGAAIRREGGIIGVVKEQKDREKAIGARARQRVIGRELRRMYDEIVQEPVPDDFIALLKQIDDNRDKKEGNA